MAALPMEIKIGIINISDRASKGIYEDLPGKAIVEILTEKQLKKVNVDFFTDQKTLSQMGYLSNHTDPEEKVFEQFGKRVKHLKKPVLDNMITCLPQLWDNQTHDLFLSFIPRHKRRFFGLF